jgi:hypothetical protein
VRESLDLRRPKKQQQGEQCIMRLLSIVLLNADRVAVGYVADVSENLSAQFFGISV